MLHVKTPEEVLALIEQEFAPLPGRVEEMRSYALQLDCREVRSWTPEHPELYRQLVVRIWGWSAYFVELDKEYQDHVIARQTYTL